MLFLRRALGINFHSCPCCIIEINDECDVEGDVASTMELMCHNRFSQELQAGFVYHMLLREKLSGSVNHLAKHRP
jgi:hypothetical protein